MKCRRRSQMMVSSFVRQAISCWRIVAIGAVAVTLLLAGCSNGISNGDPAWSPDGSKIAFDSKRGDNLDIWVMNADGSNQIRLTETEAWDESPAWSPDGSKIAFVSGLGDRGNCDIWVMNADGSNQTRLISSYCGGPGWSPDAGSAWSPDGSKIAFVSGQQEGEGDICVVNADGSNQINLTNNSAREEGPAWSPDGSKIAFAREQRVRGNYDICVMNADGSNQINLTNSSPQETGPAWSPDGSKIAFNWNQGYDNDICVMNADGSNQTKLTETE